MSTDCILNNWRVDISSGSEYFPVSYGLLYNWYAATDARNIAANGWHLPTQADMTALMLYLDPGGIASSNTAGGNMKETGNIYWTSQSAGTDNSSGFNARGAGSRYEIFSELRGSFSMWLSDEYESDAERAYISYILYNNDTLYNNTPISLKYYGQSIRLLKDSTSLTHGQAGTYTGNDGKIYRTICIGTQEWLADNLCETHYRNGDLIPEVTDNAAWVALVTGARCSYNNDESNAFTI